MVGYPRDWLCTTKQIIRITPPKKELTKQWKITIFDRRYIYKWLVFQCHVSFLGGAGVRRLVGHVEHVIFSIRDQAAIGTEVVGSLIAIKKRENSFNNFTSKYHENMDKFSGWWLNQPN